MIVYAKGAWEHVIKQIKICRLSAMTMLQGFDQTWGARNVLCRRNNLHIAWNWKWQSRYRFLWWPGACPWLGRSGGLSMVGWVGVTFYMAMFHVRGAPPPLIRGAFSWFLIYLALELLAFYLQFFFKYI